MCRRLPLRIRRGDSSADHAEVSGARGRIKARSGERQRGVCWCHAEQQRRNQPVQSNGAGKSVHDTDTSEHETSSHNRGEDVRAVSANSYTDTDLRPPLGHQEREHAIVPIAAIRTASAAKVPTRCVTRLGRTDSANTASTSRSRATEMLPSAPCTTRSMACDSAAGGRLLRSAKLIAMGTFENGRFATRGAGQARSGRVRAASPSFGALRVLLERVRCEVTANSR